MRTRTTGLPEKVITRHKCNPFFFFFSREQRTPVSLICTTYIEDDIIFGVPLEQAMQYGSLTSYGFFMPDPVHQCFKEIVKRGKQIESNQERKKQTERERTVFAYSKIIMNKGLCVEGIFRLSGAASEVEQLQQEFDKPPTFGRYLDLSPYDIHAVAGVMKKYLRSLPEAVIPKALQDQFLDATGTY